MIIQVIPNDVIVEKRTGTHDMKLENGKRGLDIGDGRGFVGKVLTMDRSMSAEVRVTNSFQTEFDRVKKLLMEKRQNWISHDSSLTFLSKIYTFNYNILHL